MPLPESVSGLRAEQLGSLFFLEVLDQWQCSIGTCQVVASCEGQRGKNFSEWSQVQTAFFEIHKCTQRGTSHTHIYQSSQNIYTQKENPPWPAQHWRACPELLTHAGVACAPHYTVVPCLGPLMLRKATSLNDSCHSFSLCLLLYSCNTSVLVSSQASEVAEINMAVETE